jgi:hypothetical protein
VSSAVPWFAPDSALEGDGFEPSVPREETTLFEAAHRQDHASGVGPAPTRRTESAGGATREREPVFALYSSPSERVSHVSQTSYPHTETAYWVIPVVDNEFSVEIVSPEYHPTTVGPFATASDVKAWIAEQRQRAQFEATRVPAGG